MSSCPTCNRQIDWNAASPHRPFCSERCKLIDLGAWASERHVIPGDTKVLDDESANDQITIVPHTTSDKGPSR